LRVLLKGDPMALRVDDAVRQPLDPQARTAVVMPICNEDVDAVFAGLQATCASLAATGALQAFDIYILSDSRAPSLRAAELRAWQQLKQTLGDGAPARLYYRWRRRNSGRKAGNIADFCRRWGRLYRYMVVLDADSVMSGDCLLRMVQVMEAYPQVGIAQTAPTACAPDTLHARAQQFANRVLGRLYVAGLQYWQLGDSHYWGHNAILRVEPFMRHCALAKLPSRDGQGVEILSHDFVEAALMRRAGYEVWMLPTLAGSYEQLPAHLLDELQRDHRWCRGNLRNARLLAEPGLSGVHRALFVTGVMAYASAPLWLAYVLLGSLVPGLAGSTGSSSTTTVLWALTLLMLALPRVLATSVVWLRGEQRAFGGGAQLIRGALLEALLATLQAPVRMLAHSWSVGTAVLGLGTGWKSPPRQAQQISWRDALTQFSGWCAALGLILSLSACAQAQSTLRLLLMTGPLLLAVPLVVWTSRLDWGITLRRLGLLQVPLEMQVPGPLRPTPRPPLQAWRIGRLLPERGRTLYPPEANRRWAARYAMAIWLLLALCLPPLNQPRLNLELADFDTTLLAWQEISPLTQARYSASHVRPRTAYPINSRQGTRTTRSQGLLRSQGSRLPLQD
jgi:membrane glycosyltransferase